MVLQNFSGFCLCKYTTSYLYLLKSISVWIVENVAMHLLLGNL